MYYKQPKIGGGADSIENYFSKIWGEGLAPPKLAGGKPHDLVSIIKPYVLRDNCDSCGVGSMSWGV